MRIIYPTPDGGIAVITPVTTELNIEQIAAKDVPSGLPYLFVADADIPADRSTRDRWTADFSEPDGYGA